MRVCKNEGCDQRTGKATTCKSCQNKKFYNKDKRRAVARSMKSRISKTGWTEERYSVFNYAQGGLCYICGSPPCDNSHYRLFGDHDHKTGRPRGLLCVRCNAGIGMFLDSPILLTVAASYLEP